MGRICWDKDYRIKQHRITEDYGINMDGTCPFRHAVILSIPLSRPFCYPVIPSQPQVDGALCVGMERKVDAPVLTRGSVGRQNYFQNGATVLSGFDRLLAVLYAVDKVGHFLG